MDKMKILIMYAMEYSIKEGGQTNEGLSMQYYFFGEDGNLLKAQGNTSGAIGYQRAKCSIDIEQRRNLRTVPGIYEAEFTMKVGSDGKPVTVPTTLDFVGPCKFELVPVGPLDTADTADITKKK